MAGGGNLVDAEGPAGKASPVEEDVEGDDGKAKGDEDEDVVPETVEDEADGQRHDAGHEDSHGQGGEEGPGQDGYRLRAQLLVGGVGGEDGDGVGADAKEADVPHGEQAGVPNDEVQTYGEDGPDAEDGPKGDGEPGALPEHERDGRDDDEQRCGQPKVAPEEEPRLAGVAHHGRQTPVNPHVGSYGSTSLV